jgi:hypothetical protein
MLCAPAEFYARNGFEAVDSYRRYAGREGSVCLGKRLRQTSIVDSSVT